MTQKNMTKEILNILPHPYHPDATHGPTTDSRLGISSELPSDYRSFMKSYGPGHLLWKHKKHNTFDGEIEVFDSSCLQYDAFCDDNPVYSDLPLHAIDDNEVQTRELAKVIPWGTFRLGTLDLNWEVVNPIRPWIVSICVRVDVERYACSFSEYFLFNILRVPSPISFHSYLTPPDVTHWCYVPISQRNPIEYILRYPELVAEV